MNRVVLAGRLTADPELRYTPNGNAVANFRIAVNRPYRNQQNEQEADFINCVAWRKTAENLANYQKKGSLIGVDGRVQTRNYENNDGQRVYVTEILCEHIKFLEPRGSNSEKQDSPQGYQQAPQQEQNPFEDDGKEVVIGDDEMPF